MVSCILLIWWQAGNGGKYKIPGEGYNDTKIHSIQGSRTTKGTVALLKWI